MTEKEIAISELQQSLRNIAKNSGESVAVIPDGIFSEETEVQVKKLQSAWGLPVTGVVDFPTWEKIREENLLAIFENTAPIQTAPVSNEDFPLKKGDSGVAVEVLKNMLSKIADDYSNFKRELQNGVFDERTESQVRLWQKVADYEQTGEVDRKTWDSISKAFLL